MRASIVIASCNEGNLLRKTVESCLETTADLDCEFIIADDASEDGSIEEARRAYPQARFLAHAERRGVAQTKDLGARAARGDVLVFLDAHCKPEPGAIAGLAAGVEEMDGDAVLSPRIANLDVDRWESDPHQVGHGYSVTLESLNIGWIDLDDLSRYDGTRYRVQPTFIGCCVAMSRKLYESMGGWDTGMLYYGSEDIDFGVRTWLMGHKVLHDPEPLIGHRFRAAFDTYTVTEEHLVSNQLRMARKTFTEPVWIEWLERFRFSYPEGLWEAAWAHHLADRANIESERTHLMAHRMHDEFWFARTFGQTWPGGAFSRAAAVREEGSSSSPMGPSPVPRPLRSPSPPPKRATGIASTMPPPVRRPRIPSPSPPPPGQTPKR
jgi:GT2 family glycosyltransferase